MDKGGKGEYNEAVKMGWFDIAPFLPSAKAEGGEVSKYIHEEETK